MGAALLVFHGPVGELRAGAAARAASGAAATEAVRAARQRVLAVRRARAAVEAVFELVSDL